MRPGMPNSRWGERAKGRFSATQNTPNTVYPLYMDWGDGCAWYESRQLAKDAGRRRKDFDAKFAVERLWFGESGRGTGLGRNKERQPQQLRQEENPQN